MYPGEGTEDTRRLASCAELAEGDWLPVQRLADARLVVTDRHSAGRDVVEVAHEALTRNWGQLRAWMEEDRDFRTWKERLRATVRQWEATARDPGALLRGIPLAEPKHRLAQRKGDLEQSAQAFIQASAARARRLIWLTAGGIAFVFLAVALLTLLAWERGNEALRQTRVARARELAAHAQAQLEQHSRFSLLLAVEALGATLRANEPRFQPPNKLCVMVWAQLEGARLSATRILSWLLPSASMGAGWPPAVAITPPGCGT